MHALTVFSLPVFPIPRFDLWKRTEFFVWLTQIGRRLAVLRGNLLASADRIWPLVNVIDFLTTNQYRRVTWQPPTGTRDWKSRIPADGDSAEVTWASAS